MMSEYLGSTPVASSTSERSSLIEFDKDLMCDVNQDDGTMLHAWICTLSDDIGKRNNKLNLVIRL